MVIAYLSPALPALSETFVYEELLAVERRGIRVVPVAVRRPIVQVAAQKELAERVIHLYSGNLLTTALAGLIRLPLFGRRSFTSFSELISDMVECGLIRAEAWKLAFQFLAATQLARVLKREGCTHLHVHFADTPGQIGMYASAFSGVPFTIMAHANDIFDGGLLLKRKAERASRLLTISSYNVRYLESLGIPKERLSIVRCGVSFTTLPSPDRGDRGRAFRIGSLGRMVEKKGFDVLIHSVSNLKASGIDVELILAGDGPLQQDLQELVKRLGLAECIRFVGGLAHDQVALWMQDLDLFVLACKQDSNGDMDGIPVVLMEAMSQSVPVVSTRLSGIPELVMHEVTGLLANPNDVDDLAVQIIRVQSDAALRQSLTKKAQEYVNQEFGQGLNVDRLIHHFTHNT